jgi:hypothetical protein
MALLVVLAAGLLVGRVLLEARELRGKDSQGQTRLVALQALAEAVQVVAVLVQQALRTQPLLEQPEAQDHHRQ